jgi:hypothetical protein
MPGEGFLSDNCYSNRYNEKKSSKRLLTRELIRESIPHPKPLSIIGWRGAGERKEYQIKQLATK